MQRKLSQEIVLSTVRGIKEKLQTIENGSDPQAQALEDRRRRAGWELEFILEHVVGQLPLVCVARCKPVLSSPNGCGVPNTARRTMQHKQKRVPNAWQRRTRFNEVLSIQSLANSFSPPSIPEKLFAFKSKE